MIHRYLLVLALLAPFSTALEAAPSPDLREGIRLIKTGNARHLDRAVSLIHMAAMHEETKAEYVMGWLNLKGKGMDRAPKRAVRWFRKAAEKGHLKSQIALGRLLGHSKKSSYQNEAREWLEEARSQGSPTAKMLLTELEKGRLGDDMMDKTEGAMTPAGSGSSRKGGTAMAPKAMTHKMSGPHAMSSKAMAHKMNHKMTAPHAMSSKAMAHKAGSGHASDEGVVLNLGSGTPATPEEEAMLAKRLKAQTAAQNARQQRWSREAAARAAAEARQSAAQVRGSGYRSSRTVGSGSSR